MERTVENNITIGDLLCIMRDMGITTKFYIIGKVNTTKPMTAKELLDELACHGEDVLWYCVTSADNVDGKIYVTVE